MGLSHFYIIFLDLCCAGIIFVYGKYRRDNPKFVDPLHINLLPSLFDDFDGWSVSHFCFNFTQGFLFPNNIIFITCMGASWELFELIYGKTQPKILKGLGGSKEHGVWWYAKWSDLVVNMCGVLTGYAIQYYFF